MAHGRHNPGWPDRRHGTLHGTGTGTGTGIMRLILVRHPQPLAEPGTCYGSTDLPVMPGEPEKALAALRASAILPADAPIYSSPLQRCAALATLLGTPIFDARLRELDFGDWEMRHWDAIPRAGIDAWAADMAGYRPGGGESATQAAQRVLAFHTELLQLPHSDAIIVCHAGVMRLLMACETGLTAGATALRAARAEHRIGYGEAIILEATR